MLNWSNLLERLREMFPSYRPRSDIEEYVESKQPKTAADVEHYMRQYIYNQQFMRGL
jgi:hypothetical protein